MILNRREDDYQNDELNEVENHSRVIRTYELFGYL